MKKYIILIAAIASCYNSYAQVIGEINVLDRDAFYLYYSIPTPTSDNITYQKWSTRFGLSPILMKKMMILNSLGIDMHQFNYNVNKTASLSNFYNINYSLIGIYKFSDKWKLNIQISPILLSNQKNKLSSDDFSFNGRIVAERTYLRKNEGYFQIALGLGYLTLNGTTKVTPLASIKSRLNKKYSFVLGIPNTYLKYDITKKHTIKALVDLNDFSAHISPKETTYFKAVFTICSAGLEYNYWFKKSFGIMFKATHTIYNSYELRDRENESAYNFDIKPKRPFITIGIKFNPIRSLQQKQKLKPII